MNIKLKERLWSTRGSRVEIGGSPISRLIGFASDYPEPVEGQKRAVWRAAKQDTPVACSPPKQKNAIYARAEYRAFTIIELMVVMSLIAIVMGLFYSGIKTSTESAKATQCIANLKKIGQALQIYATENNSWTPISNENNAVLGNVEGGPVDIRFELGAYDNDLWNITCPMDVRRKYDPDPANPSYLSYGYNAQFGCDLAKVEDNYIIIQDASPFHFMKTGRWKAMKLGVLYADGHAEALNWW